MNRWLLAFLCRPDTAGCTWADYDGYDLISSHGLSSPSSASPPSQRNLGTASSAAACRTLCSQHTDCVAYSYFSASHSGTSWRQYCVGTSYTAHSIEKDTSVTSAICISGGQRLLNDQCHQLAKIFVFTRSLGVAMQVCLLCIRFLFNQR